MAINNIKESLSNKLDQLPYDLQIKVLDFASSLSPKGIKGKELLKFKSFIPEDDLRQISKAIEETCEKADINEW